MKRRRFLASLAAALGLSKAISKEPEVIFGERQPMSYSVDTSVSDRLLMESAADIEEWMQRDFARVILYHLIYLWTKDMLLFPTLLNKIS